MTKTVIKAGVAALATAVLPLASLPAVAQEAQTGTDQPAQETAPQQDVVVATVGGEEIRSSDVTAMMGALPPQVRNQPQEMLVPFVLDQLVLRELILQQAQAENLGEDPEVTELVQGETDRAREDAMVQVWIQRELEGAVTDEDVQTTYDQVAAQSEQELPPLADVRPQIEQQLQQQALTGIRADLEAGTEIVFYGPGGEPIEEPAQGQNGAGNGADTGEAAEDTQ